MSIFMQAEIDYQKESTPRRLATVGTDGHPHVVPVGCRYDPEQDTIDIGRHDFAKRKKFRDVRNRSGLPEPADVLVEALEPCRVPRQC